MNFELETWLVDVGNLIINKEAEQGASKLSEAERAVYWMWMIDYAVRNSGSFGPLEDMDSSALSDLQKAAWAARLSILASWLEEASDEEAFCRTYHEHFYEACTELKAFYEHRAQAQAGS